MQQFENMTCEMLLFRKDLKKRDCTSLLFPYYCVDTILKKKSCLYVSLHFFLELLLFILCVLPCVVQSCSIYSNTGSAENIITLTFVIVWFQASYEQQTTVQQLILVVIIILSQ
jgi:hypothetical protein